MEEQTELCVEEDDSHADHIEERDCHDDHMRDSHADQSEERDSHADHSEECDSHADHIEERDSSEECDSHASPLIRFTSCIDPLSDASAATTLVHDSIIESFLGPSQHSSMPRPVSQLSRDLSTHRSETEEEVDANSLPAASLSRLNRRTRRTREGLSNSRRKLDIVSTRSRPIRTELELLTDQAHLAKSWSNYMYIPADRSQTSTTETPPPPATATAIVTTHSLESPVTTHSLESPVTTHSLESPVTAAAAIRSSRAALPLHDPYSIHHDHEGPVATASIHQSEVDLVASTTTSATASPTTTRSAQTVISLPERSSRRLDSSGYTDGETYESGDGAEDENVAARQVGRSRTRDDPSSRSSLRVTLADHGHDSSSVSSSSQPSRSRLSAPTTSGTTSSGAFLSSTMEHAQHPSSSSSPSFSGKSSASAGGPVAEPLSNERRAHFTVVRDTANFVKSLDPVQCNALVQLLSSQGQRSTRVMSELSRALNNRAFAFQSAAMERHAANLNRAPLLSSTRTGRRRPNQSSLLFMERNWNNQYQQLLDMPEGVEKYRRLSHLGKDFVQLATLYGKVIISELHLPRSSKTINPITSSMGGVAGGEKYVTKSILFKFALDMPIHSHRTGGEVWIYGGTACNHEYAIKNAGHELKGLMSYYNCRIRSLRTPLMALIDYCGYRLIAQSYLPVHKTDTLCYGSADGGVTVHASDPVLNKLMRKAAKKINLKPHLIIPHQLSSGVHGAVEIHGPGDIEGHRGEDEHYYVLDFGRVMPPACPRDVLTAEDARNRTVFREKLRPEFVRMYRVPLSSDAFTQWGRHKFTEHNAEVARATRHLENVLIPAFVAELLSSNHDLTIVNVLTNMHKNGINIRYLGRIRSLVREQSGGAFVHGHTAVALTRVHQIQVLLLEEMIGRALKVMLRKLWRERTEQEGECMVESLKETAVDLLNCTAGYSFDSSDFWTKQVKPTVQRQFPDALATGEIHTMCHLEKTVDLSAIVFRLAEMVGLHFSEEACEGIKSIKNPGDFRFLDSDLEDLIPKAKHMNLIEHCQAMSLVFEMKELAQLEAKQAISRAVSRRTQVVGTGVVADPPSFHSQPKTLLARDRLFVLANRKFSQAVMLTPDSYETLFAWGDLLYEQGKSKTGRIGDSLTTAAFLKYEIALSIRTEPAAVYYVAELMFERALHKKVSTAPVWKKLIARAAQHFEHGIFMEKGTLGGADDVNGEEDEQGRDERLGSAHPRGLASGHTTRNSALTATSAASWIEISSSDDEISLLMQSAVDQQLDTSSRQSSSRKSSSFIQSEPTSSQRSKPGSTAFLPTGIQNEIPATAPVKQQHRPNGPESQDGPPIEDDAPISSTNNAYDTLDWVDHDQAQEDQVVTPTSAENSTIVTGNKPNAYDTLDWVDDEQEQEQEQEQEAKEAQLLQRSACA